MTRREIEEQYDVEDGRIESPGKFEGEPVWAPAFWDLGLSGLADEDDGESFAFALDADDARDWPELAEVARVRLWEDEQGFVRTETVSR